MKNSCVVVFVLLLITSWSASASSLIREGSIGASAQTQQQETNTISPFKFFPVSEWTGMKFIFLPQPMSSRQYGYVNFTDENRNIFSYDEYVGRITTVVGVVRSDYISKVRFRMDDDSAEFSVDYVDDSVDDIAPLADIINARSEYIGDTLWYKSASIVGYDFNNDKFIGDTIAKYSPVIVTDIVAGWYAWSPVRFIIKTIDGREGFVDVTMSGTNVPQILLKRNRFEDYFLTSDPRLSHDWSRRVWSAIERGTVYIGMTQEQVRMSWGEPKEINRTSLPSAVNEQWVYGSGNYVYLTSGKVSAIQN